MTTKYQRGASFERRVLKYLIGDNTLPTHGYLHTLVPAVLDTLSMTIPPPSLYGIRTAGSRGDYDLLIIGSWELVDLHMVIGIQCKIGNMSENRMDSDLRRIYNTQQIPGVYAHRKSTGKKIMFYPDIELVVKQILGGINK